MKKILLCLLALCLLSSLVACTQKTGGESESAQAIEPSPSEIVSEGRIAENALPHDAALVEWLAEAAERTVVKNAVLFSRGDGVWCCWLYLGDWTEGDTLTFGADTADGYRVVLSHAAQRTDGAEEAGGVFYFTVQTDAEPNFDLYVNKESEGLVVTHSDEPVAKP